MKKRWTCILLALGLMLALACGAALAEDELKPVIRFSNVNENDALSMAIVPSYIGNIIHGDGWMEDMGLENLDQLIAEYGETEPSWSVQLVDGPDMEACTEYHGLDDVALIFKRQPESDCEITYRVICNWDGHVGTRDITFVATTLAENNLPTGNTLQELYVIGAGQTLTVTGDLLPSGWRVPGREDHNSFGLWEYGFTHQNEEDYTIVETSETTATFTSDKPGVYVFNGFISRGNVRGGGSVFILVTDDDAPVHISIRPDQLLTCEPCAVAIAAPGAEAIRVYGCSVDRYQNEGLDGLDPYWEGEGETFFSEDGDSTGGSFIYAVSACINGEWTDPNECIGYATWNTPYGELYGDLITLSTLEIQPYESIVININQIDNAETTYAYLWAREDLTCPELDEHITTAEISGSDLTPGGIYNVGASATATGYRNTFQRQWFMVNYENVSYDDSTIVDDHNSTLTLRIPDLEFDTFTDHPFTLFAPGADAVEFVLYSSNGEGGLEEINSRLEWEPGMYVPDALNIRHPGEYVLKARARYGEENGEENWTNPDDCQATITINAHDDLPSPSATMSDRAYLGDTVTLHFDETPNAVSYSYWVHRWDSGDGIYFGSREDAGDLVIDTNELWGPGVYLVEVDVNAPGYREGHGCLHLMVLDPNDQELSGDGCYFFVSSTDILTQEQFHLMYYVPGAEMVRVAYGDEWGVESGCSGVERWDSFGWPEEISVYGAACFEGEWSEPEFLCTLSVTAPYGDLGEVNGWTSIATPYGSNIEIHYHGNENAVNYSYWFRLEDGGDGLGGGGFEVDENTVFPYVLYQPTDDLEPGSLYRVMLDASAPGYVQGHSEALFIVEGNPDENITLSMPDSLPAGATFEVHVDAPSADKVIICTSLDGVRWNDSYREADGYSEWYVADSFGMDGGTVWVWAAAHIDGSWNHVTECRTIEVSPAQGQAGSPTFSMSHTNVQRGDFVKATLGSVPQAAYCYGVFIKDENDNVVGDFSRGDAGDIYIPTANLPAGRYTVHGYVRAENFINGESEYDLPFTVNDPEGYGGGLYVLNPNVQTGERIVWSLYAKYADHVAFCVTGDPDSVNRPQENWWHHEDGDWLYAGDWWYDCLNTSGTYYAYIGAHFHNDDNGTDWWDYVGTPVEIHVSAPNGSFDPPSATMTDKAYLGDTVTIHFDETENAVSYSYWVHPDDSGEWVTGDSREGAGDLLLDTNSLWGSGVYWVELDVNAPGYQEGHGTLHIAVLDPDDIELSGDGYYFTTGATEVQTGVDVHFIYYVPGAEAVRITFDEFWGFECEGPGMDKWWAWNPPQQVPVSVAARFGEEWTDPTQMCTVNVIAPEGNLPEPNISMPTVVNPGEDVVITYYGNEPAVNYSYWYEKDNGEWMGQQGFDLRYEEEPHEFPRTLIIPAEELEPGCTYYVHLDVNCPGWAEGHGDRTLVVTNPGSQQVTLKVNGSTENRTMPVNQDYSVTVEAEGADIVGFFDGWTWQWENGSSFTWTWSDMSDGSRTMVAQAWYADGSSATSNTIEMNYTVIDACGTSYSTVTGASFGGDITVTFGAAEHATLYDLHIVRQENTDDEVYYYRYTEPGTYTVSTRDAGLVPGSYYAYVSTAGIGYGWSSDWYQNGPQEKDLFTVTEGQPFFSVDKTTVEVMEHLHVIAYDPEATRIRYDDGYGWWRNEDGEESGWEVENGFWETYQHWDCGQDNVVIKAEGWHEDHWVEIGSAAISIIAPNGTMDAPNVDVNPYQGLEYGLWFGVERPENCPEYDIEVWEWIDDPNLEDPRVWKLGCQRCDRDDWYCVNSDDLELGHTYTVFVRTLGYGYDCFEVSYDVTMVDEISAPEFGISTHSYVVGAGNRMTGFATQDGEPMNKFVLELESPNNHWTEYWCVYDGSFGWWDNSTPCFPWGTEEVGQWRLRIAPCSGSGFLMGPWSEWQYFEVTAPDLDNMSTFRLPDSLETVYSEAFANTNMEMVYIPAGVTEIQSRAFAECANLKLVVFEGDIEISIAEDAFADCQNLVFVAHEHSDAWHWCLNHGQDVMDW